MPTHSENALGEKLLFLVKARFGAGMFHPGNLESELWAGIAATEVWPSATPTALPIMFAGIAARSHWP